MKLMDADRDGEIARLRIADLKAPSTVVVDQNNRIIVGNDFVRAAQIMQAVDAARVKPRFKIETSSIA